MLQTWIKGQQLQLSTPCSMQKNIFENPECRCGPECTNYRPDICKYSMQFRKCYNVRCYRIQLKGTMRKRSQQEKHHAQSHPQTNQFHNPCRPANSAFANKPQKTKRFFTPHNITSTPINSYTYSHNPILP